MPTYNYIVKDAEGKTIEGSAEIKDKDALVAKLRSENYIIISIEPVLKKHVSVSFFAKKVKLDDLVIFSRQLATMVEAGMSLIAVLDVLVEQVENPSFKTVIKRLREDIEGGLSLSQAMTRHPQIFSQLFVNMVKAGEISGTLDTILNRVAIYFEKMASLQRKLKTAMIYPTAVVFIAIAITIFLLVKVVPTFKGIFDMLGAELPMPTKLLIMVSDFAKHYLLYGIGGVFVFLMIVRRIIKTSKGRFVFDKIQLKLPVFGKIIQKVSIAKFARTLSILTRSGVPILVSLDIVGKTSGNKVVEKIVEDARGSIRDGKSISDPLLKSSVFPPMVVRMISVGEKTGQLEKMLVKIADFYDEQVDAAVTGLTSLIEPLIIVFLGVIIGSIVLAIFLPIFKMTQVIGH
ncbi:MAG: type II secretion system F family protein [Candidatus Omnitrophota bacterium]